MEFKVFVFPRLAPVVTYVLCGVFAGYAQPTTSTPQPSSTLLEEALKNPILRAVLSRVKTPAAEPKVAAPEQTASSCPAIPLDPITDPATQELEAATGPDVVDLAGMLPAAARALNLFEVKLASVGGTMVLKSAYRPAAYQQHLQNVWYKWMELRANHDPSCQELRAEVQQEFAKHHLIESQHPVSVSDHTRGIAFDARVNLPANARIGRRRLTLDGLARLAGFLRPAIVTDPVHFKYLTGARPVAVLPGRLAGVRTVSVRRRGNV
jgi:D-alanyl-D-alanine dipeptidase